MLSFAMINSVHISERQTQLPEQVIGKLLKIAVENKDIISLGPGEPDFPTAQPILNYGAKILQKGLGTHYSPPSGRAELKDEIVKKLKRDNKISAKPENIIVTTGSTEGLLLSLLATIDVGEQVLVPNPSFLAYSPTVDIIQGFPVAIELKEENKWEINPDDVRAAIVPKKTRALILNTPANPTGNVIRRKTLEELADIAIENNLFVFCDEAYEKLVYDNTKHVSFASLNGVKDYAVTLQTFSKSYAMCGFRLGYVVGSENLIKYLVKSHIYTTLTSPTISQMMATKALQMSGAYTEKMRREYDRRRKFIVKRLNEIGLPTVNPKGAFYAFSNIKKYGIKSMDFAERALKEAKVAVIPGTEFGKFGEGFVRFSYATDYKLIEEGLRRLHLFVKRL